MACAKINVGKAPGPYDIMGSVITDTINSFTSLWTRYNEGMFPEGMEDREVILEEA